MFLSLSPFQSVTVLHSLTGVGLREFQSVTQSEDVTLVNRRKPLPGAECNSVTVGK